MGPGAIDFAGIGTVITALTGTLLTVGTVLTTRQRSSALNATQVQTELEARTEQYQMTTRHMSLLEETLREKGLTVPARPEEMSAKWWAERIGLDAEKKK